MNRTIELVGDELEELARTLRQETKAAVAELAAMTARFSLEIQGTVAALTTRIERLEQRQAKAIERLEAEAPSAIIDLQLEPLRERLNELTVELDRQGRDQQAELRAVQMVVGELGKAGTVLAEGRAQLAADIEGHGEAIKSLDQRIEGEIGRYLTELRPLVGEVVAAALEQPQAALASLTERAAGLSERQAVLEQMIQGNSEALREARTTVTTFTGCVQACMDQLDRPAELSPEGLRSVEERTRELIASELAGLRPDPEIANAISDSIRAELPAFARLDMTQALEIIRQVAEAELRKLPPPAFPAPRQWRAEADYARGTLVRKDGGLAWVGDDGQLHWLAHGLTGRARCNQEDGDPRRFRVELDLSGDAPPIGLSFYLPVPIHRGLYHSQGEYELGDEVAWNGSTWRCVALSAGGEPGGSDDWTLVAKQGKAGRRAPGIEAVGIAKEDGQPHVFRLLFEGGDSISTPVPEPLEELLTVGHG